MSKSRDPRRPDPASRPGPVVADWEVQVAGTDEPVTIKGAVLRTSAETVALLDPADSEHLFFADRKAVAYVRRVPGSASGSEGSGA